MGHRSCRARTQELPTNPPGQDAPAVAERLVRADAVVDVAEGPSQARLVAGRSGGRGGRGRRSGSGRGRSRLVQDGGLAVQRRWRNVGHVVIGVAVSGLQGPSR